MDFLKKLIFEVNNNGDLFLIKTDSGCFTEISKYFDKETVRQMISHKNRIGLNFLFKFTSSFAPILDETFKIFGADVDLFNDLIDSKDENGKTFWMLLDEIEMECDESISPMCDLSDWLENHSLSIISNELFESVSSDGSAMGLQQAPKILNHFHRIPKPMKIFPIMKSSK